MKNLILIRILLGILATTALTACGGSDGSNDPVTVTPTPDPDPIPDPVPDPVPPTQYHAVIASVSPSFDSSDIEIVDLSADTLIAKNAYAPSADSDITVSSNGEYFYRIGRYDIDTITKYSINAPSTPIWQYSTKDSITDATANPYKLIVASETKAYLLRYGSNVLWVVNPSATTEAEFKTAEIDLSAYDEGDGKPEMSDAIVVGDKLYITLERQYFYDPSLYPSYIAVIDTTADSEIETHADDSDGMMGIPLQTHNAGSLSYNANVGLIVQSIGDYGSSYVARPISYIGGIEVVDTADYTTSMLVDDGDDTEHSYGLITNVAIVSDAIGYFTGYTGWQSISLYRFSPATGAVETTPVAGFDGIDIRGLALDPENRLWVSVADDSAPRIEVLDTTTNALSDTIETVLNPTTVVFTQTTTP